MYRALISCSVLIAIFAIAGCGGNGGNPSRASWTCPPEWVATAQGGCGPAVVVCGADGGAAPYACGAVDLTSRRTVVTADGGTGVAFYRQPDGAIGGGWYEPGDPGGPPAADWSPDAGIPSCPPGWTHLDDARCDPMLRADCPTGTGALPGGACVATAASDCPSTEFPDVSAEVGAATILRVRAGADPSVADGSSTHPYATIGAAVASAGSGDWVVVAAGVYNEMISATTIVHIVGACSARVRIVGGAAHPTVQAFGPGAQLDLRGVTASGMNFGLDAENRARLHASGVSVEAATGTGLMVSGSAHFTAENLRVSGTLMFSDGTAGRGVNAQEGADVTLSRTVIDGNVDDGVFAIDPTTIVRLQDSIVRATRSRRSDPITGRGIELQGGAAVEVTRTVIESNHDVGLLVTGVGTHATLLDAIVRETLALADGSSGAGVYVDHGSVMATRLLIDGNLDVGATVGGVGATVTLEDSVVMATRANGSGTHGHGIEAAQGGRFVVRRVRIEDNREVGIAAIDDGSHVEMEDVIVHGTREQAGLSGYGLLAQNGGSATGRHVVFAENQAMGAGAWGAGAVVDLSDAVVRDTATLSDGRFGRGVEVEGGGVLTGERMTVIRNQDVGAFASGSASELHLADCAIVDTQRSNPDAIGVNVEATPGALVTIDRTSIRGSSCGVLIDGADAHADLHDVAIRSPRAYADGRFGRGVTVQLAGALNAGRLLVEDAVESGIVSADDGSRVDLSDTIVRHVQPSGRGFGAGIFVYNAGSASANRVAVVDVSGAGIAAASLDTVGNAVVGGASVSGDQLYVSGILSSTIGLSGSDPTALHVSGPVVAYGLHAGSECAADFLHTVVDNAGYGVFVGAGRMSLHSVVLAHQLDAAGAKQTASMLVLEDIHYANNVRDDVVIDDTLPELAALPPPTSVCPIGGCN